MNISDSERVAAVLESSSYKATPNVEEADLIAVTMCSIRQSAVDRVHGLVEKFKKLRKANPKLKTILTGCVLKKDKKIFIDGFDEIIDVKEFFNFDIAPKYSSPFSANVPIMTGCNNFCSYCVVPYTRNREISRPAKEIILEIENLVKNNCKEVWLLGQNVNSYKDGKTNFPELLRQINKLSGEFWVRFTSSHPKDFTQKVIDVMAEGKHITPYLNLPIQSGDDKVLKSMNRHYTVAQYKAKISALRKKIPHIAISTDIIVGFPGETKKQFENTVKLFRDVKYDMAYINKYSERAGTAAAKLKDNVSWEEKKRREKVLTQVLKETALEKNKLLVGKELNVLINESRGDNYYGKDDHYKTIRVISKKNILGKIIKVKITEASPFTLRGEIINAENPARPNALALGGKLVVILGPTASGKTDLSIKLAKKYNGEVVSADSRQVYKGMDVGSGKVTKKEMLGVPHHLLDVANPKRKFTVAQYQKLALKAIKNIQKRGKLPILVGGTGFYIQSIVDGIVIPEVKPNWELRKKLEKIALPELFKRLQKLDPVRAGTIDKNNPRRVLRALEIVMITGKPVPSLRHCEEQSDEAIQSECTHSRLPRSLRLARNDEWDTLPELGARDSLDVLQIGVSKTAEELKNNINKRLLKRLEKNALIREVKKLQKTVFWKRLEEFGLEYRFVAQYLQNKITYQEMIDKIQIESEHFAKRQMTWFKRDKRISWIETPAEAIRLLDTFIKK